MVVWAQVNNIGVTTIGDSIAYDLLEDDSMVIEEECLQIGISVGVRGGNPDGADRYECWVYPLRYAQEAGTGDARACYFVEELTVGTLKQTIREIEEKVNNTWGRDYDEVLMKLSWIAQGEWEFIYEAKEPALNPDGTINYDPRAYMTNSIPSQGMEAARKGLN